MSFVRLGVDVGGTNTDAVLLSGRSLLATCKHPTTPDVELGVFRAITHLLQQAKLQPADIASVTIGTTQFTNAFVERRRLLPIGVIRLGAPYSTGIPPLCDWPKELTDVVGLNTAILAGGYEFDGREIAPLDEEGVRAAARSFRERNIRSIAISSTFAPVNGEMERRAAQILREEIPGVHITLSGDIGRMGLIERENAAAMNASLADLAATIIASFRHAIKRLGIQAEIHISQNDGTLLSAAQVERHPILTFASGPTNSIRGAALLSGLEDAVIIDIGGTTSDVGYLVKSFPRESAISVDIGGVRTNFRMPDLISVALGGGSIIKPGENPTIGPESVGHELMTRALVFGGDTLTATDIVVAAGRTGIGDRALVANLPEAIVESVLGQLHTKLEEAVDRIKTSRADVPLVLVGGGSILVSRPLKGVSKIVVPQDAAVANAVGAAIAQVSGEIDKYYNYNDGGRSSAVSDAKAMATSRALSAGADPETVEISEVEETPLAYLPGDMVRVRVKAIGDLKEQRKLTN